jgi:hypothetical protein
MFFVHDLPISVNPALNITLIIAGLQWTLMELAQYFIKTTMLIKNYLIPWSSV